MHMANNEMRVNGRHGESMWLEGDEVCFKSANTVHRLDKGAITTFDVMNVEDARKAVAEASEVAGTWTDDMPSTKGKSILLVACSKDLCWVMEATKSQSSNAIGFVREICPVVEDDEPEYKLYAAIQTPKGALFTVGSIACVFAAFYTLSVLEMPIITLVLAGLGIFMFINIK